MSTPHNSSSPYPWVFTSIPPEMVTQEWCTLHRLIDELSAVQHRLGTPLEEPDDYQHVRDLGHQIRNKLHLVQMWAELGMVQRDEVYFEASAV